MKKFMIGLLILCILTVVVISSEKERSNVEVIIPDISFKNVITSEIPNYKGEKMNIDILKNITKLEGKKLYIQAIEGIELLRNVKNIKLSNNEIVNINHLKDLKEIEVLDLSNNNILDLRVLDKLPNLKELYIKNNPVLYNVSNETYNKLEKKDFYLSSSLVEQPKTLVINEVMSNNKSTIFDSDKNASDWIEIYNYGNKAIDLSYFRLSDSIDNKFKWKFPKIMLQPKKHFVIWATGKDICFSNDEIHTNFKLDKDGEKLILTYYDKTVIDSVILEESKEDMSLGRREDNYNDNFLYLAVPTPKQIIDSVTIDKIDEVLQPPTFSKQGGFYEEEFYLELNCGCDDGKIYYTTDGSEPSLNSKQYTKPILIKSRKGDKNKYSEIRDMSIYKYYNKLSRLGLPMDEVFKATVIRARTIKDGCPYSDMVTKTYFVDKNIKSKYSIPVVSIVTKPSNLFCNDKGIFMLGNRFYNWRKKNKELNFMCDANYNQRGKRWERKVNIEYFVKGREVFNEIAGLKIFGEGTRNTPQKSSKICFREEYNDKDSITYDIYNDLINIQGEKIDNFKNIILRASGNDCFNTFIRDSLMQQLLKGTTLDLQASKPIILFINGEYWGIRNIREVLDEKYINSHYGIEEKDVVIIEDYNEVNNNNYKYVDELERLLSYISSCDMTLEGNYNYVCSNIDIKNCIEYLVAEIYFGNTDWPSNNLKMWKSKNGTKKYITSNREDGKWRFLIFDLDYGFGLYKKYEEVADVNVLKHLTEDKENELSGLLFSKLLTNDKFKISFLNTMADWINSRFTEDNVRQNINLKTKEIKNEVPEYLRRNSMFDGNYNDWYTANINNLYNFAKLRNNIIMNQMVQYFKLSGVSKVNVDLDTIKGSMFINSIKIDCMKWEGKYFKDIPIEIKAIPKEGYKFIRWKIGYENNYSSNTEIILTNDVHYFMPIFEKIER
jgi:hypothetical protein